MPSHPTSNPSTTDADRIALAARASLICPFMVVLIALLTHWLPPAVRVAGELAAGAVAVFGLICAITAITRGRRAAGSSLAIQGGIGLVIGLVFVGIVLNNYLRAQPTAGAGSAVVPGNSPQVQRLSAAVARFVAKTSELEQRLVAAAKPLGASPVLDLTAVDSAAVLTARQATVESYLAASHALSNHVVQAQGFLEAQLQEHGATPEEARTNAGEFLRNIGAQLSMSRQLRELEFHYSTTLIQALELLKQHWGAWKTQPQGTPVFEAEPVNLEYGAFLKRLGELEARDRELKRQLSNP